MRRRPSRPLRPAAVGLAALLAVAGAAAATPAAAAAPAALPTTTLTQVLPGLAQLQSLGALDGAKHLQVGVSMLGLTRSARDRLYTAMTTPGTAAYGRTLTPAQFNAAFSVPKATLEAVVASVTASGLTVSYTSADNSYLLLDGTVAQVDTTFKVVEEQFVGSAGKVFRATRTGATVPVGVDTVLGLTDASAMQLAKTPAVAPTQDLCLATQCTGTLQPADLWSVYDQPGTDTGQGQKVAIFGEGKLDTVVADVRQFQIDHGLTRGTDSHGNALTVPIRRVPIGDDLTDDSGVGEWDLDSAAITGMAPGLDQLNYYFGQDLSDSAIAGTYSAWANDPVGPLTGNSSFGGCEPLEAATGSEVVDDVLLKQAAMEGRTMFVSTGDTGSGGCIFGVPVNVNGVANGGVPAVEYPSASPYVVAVGGSVLYTNVDANTGNSAVPATRNMEYAWTHTGGGASIGEPEPSDQSTITVIKTPCAVTPDGGVATSLPTCRGVPDVAAVSGDIATNNYAIYSGGAETASGGTSLSSPLWAGMWARVLAAHPTSCQSKYSATTDKTVGFAQPALYAVGLDQTLSGTTATSTVDSDAFFDIGNTSGTSLPTGNGAYTALPRTPGVDPTGWDFVSGLGTPDITHIAEDLDCGSLTPAATPTVYAADVTEKPGVIGGGAACTPGVQTSPSGNDTNPTGVGPTVQDPQIDLVLSTITTTGTGTSEALVWTNTVQSLTTAPAVTGDQGQDFQNTFVYGGKTYVLDQSIAAGDTADTFVLDSENTTTFTLTKIATLTGTVSRTAGTISIVMPFSAFNTAAGLTGTDVFGPGSAPTGLTVFATDGGQTAVDTLTFDTSCPYVVSGGAVDVPVMPDAPYAALLLLVGAGGAGTIVTRRRRRALAAA